MKKYKKYKPSGIKWIGDIPEHWVMIKTKYIGEAIIGLTYSPSEIVENEKEGTLVLRSSNIQNNKLSLKDNIYVNKEIKEKLITQKGDILICSRNGSAKLVGKNITIDEKTAGASFGAFMSIYRSNHWAYMSKVFNSPIFTSQTALFNTSTINQLTTGTLNNLVIPFPKVEKEQTQIATYLDQKTTQINQTITQKEKLIELYEEEKKAMINQAVTKGLNKKVKLKSSGIEWLGNVPEHWEVKRLKYLVSERLQYGANEPAEDDDTSQPRYIRITDFGNDGNLRKNTFRSLIFDKAKDYLLQEGDVLFARSGATVGKTFQFKNYKGDACFAGYLIKARPDINQVLSDWLYLFTKSSLYEMWKNSIFIQATIQNIGADKYNQLVFPVPSLKEQSEIVRHIEEQSERINKAITKAKKEIELIKEYRQALIFEAVTGKIDVREETT